MTHDPRPMTRLLIAITVARLLSPAPLKAQVPFDACYDRQHRRIPGVVDNTIAYAAQAGYRDGHRVIVWNQHSLSQNSRALQLFVYLHECAHHSLNHLTKGESRTIEQQADCWAIQLMVDGGMINGSGLHALTQELRNTTGDINHLGGDALLISLQQCLDIRTDRAAWGTALTALTTAAASGFDTIRGSQVEDADPGFFEATQGAPGVYDCEVVGSASLSCMLFAARKQKSVESRFETIVKIVQAWLPPAWTSTTVASPPEGMTRQFLAQDSDTGMLLVLAVTPQARLYFVVRR